jgi:pimeloyl-ACP methyl ester carboxylesterase
MNLPIGYHKFHKNDFINYQLNRWHSLGYARFEDIKSIGSAIHNFDDYVNAFATASKTAVREGRLKNAAMYCRASEFLIPPADPVKITAYHEFIRLFEIAFSEDDYERHQVPYREGFLSVIKFPAKTTEVRGTIIGCGGFDSFIEEFYCIWDYFAENGYDTIAFEGPGQGGTLRSHNMHFEHDWEKPVAAVLDYFNIREATALGISMGGYWIMRAAAFDKRIKRVIATPPVYDWLELTNSLNRALVKWMVNFPVMLNFFVRLKMNIGLIRHTVNNALFIQGKDKPIDAVHWLLGMNKDHLNSHLIEQDVLLLGGENDAFQPPELMKKQREALINANSVTERIFKKSENADQHCQMGNIGLALETIHNWLNNKSI